MKFQNKYVIGLTGGIGSGKSMVLNLLKEHFNAEIIDADKIGHSILNYGTKGYMLVIKAFGKDIITNNDEKVPCIDRKKLGSIVFSSTKSLQILNDITHPIIFEEIENIIKSSTSSLIIVEAALLIESNLINLCDNIWYVYADKEVRIKRLQESRDMNREKALQIMSNQPDENEYKNKSDVIIDNSGYKEDTLLQIRQNIPGGNIWVR